MEMVKKTNNIKYIFTGILISVVLTIMLLFILSIILTYTSVAENIIKPAIIIITGISILLGSSIANLKIKKRGILNGAIIGGIYLLTIYLLSSIISRQFVLSGISIVIILIGMILGILGGIIGVNKK